MKRAGFRDACVRLLEAALAGRWDAARRAADDLFRYVHTENDADAVARVADLLGTVHSERGFRVQWAEVHDDGALTWHDVTGGCPAYVDGWIKGASWRPPYPALRIVGPTGERVFNSQRQAAGEPDDMGAVDVRRVEIIERACETGQIPVTTKSHGAIRWLAATVKRLARWRPLEILDEPTEFRCRRCRRMGYRRGKWHLWALDSFISRDGVVVRKYRCKDCGYGGWSRHPRLQEVELWVE